MINQPESQQLIFLQLIDKYKVEIPIIQRDYAQGREGKEELRESFLSAIKNASPTTPLVLDFVYGSITNNTFQPIDGQQRLTTLFLLHWFIAQKEGKLTDELKKQLSKFTYETRISSREFCKELIEQSIVYDTDEIISNQIIDSHWFFLSWKKDPTIKSMLTMLDAIQHNFKDENNFWEKLKYISFHFMDLENFGLTDDLYIKMNARGKALTDFENFKAKFEQHIKQNNWEEDVAVEEKFSHKIDTDWADLFWNYRHEETYIFDKQFLNFFRTMAVIHYALRAEKDDNFKTNVDLLRDNSKIISFNRYVELNCFDEGYFRSIKSVLNKISNRNGLTTFLSGNDYANEKEIFKGSINNDLSYADLVIAYAYYKYLELEQSVDKELLKNWMRIVRNLVEGSRPYLFNNVTDLSNALKSINNLLKNRNCIINHFKNLALEKNTLRGFTSEQVKEEKIKAKLISDSIDWEKAIIKIENHPYFKGQIGFLLDWCKDENGNFSIDKFNQYTVKSEAIFDENGLKEFKDFLFDRALLAKGDYLLRKGPNHSFLINSERNISWKRLLRDKNEKRNYLKELIDEITVEHLSDKLYKIINDFSLNDWRYYFIKQPEMIGVCGSQKLIRKSSNNNILLLGSTTTSGYHKEYYSFSLYNELLHLQQVREINYLSQRSVNEWKFFNYEGIKIAFDPCKEKYVLLELEDENMTSNLEFNNREEVKNYLIQTPNNV